MGLCAGFGSTCMYLSEVNLPRLSRPGSASMRLACLKYLIVRSMRYIVVVVASIVVIMLFWAVNNQHCFDRIVYYSFMALGYVRLSEQRFKYDAMLASVIVNELSSY